MAAVGITYSKDKEISKLTEYKQDASGFINWIQGKYPEVWKVWEKQ